jgi:AcrR family transcriptional regulator
MNVSKKKHRGPGRTTRQDWIRIALDTLVSDGVEQVKVLVLAEKIDCARSSFYWYFKNRADLLDSLLEHWQATNTRAILDGANQPAQTINAALGHLLASWVGPGRFDTRLDFAVRDWARRDGSVRRALDQSDAARIEAICEMFLRYGYASSEADVRARIVYFTQIGYDVLDQQESWQKRTLRVRDYLYCHTGVAPTDAEVDALVKRLSDDLANVHSA